MDSLLNDRFSIAGINADGVPFKLDCGVYAKFIYPEAVSTLVVYSQNDPRWANKIYAHALTFAKAGCLVCCVTMVISAVYPETILPPEVSDNLKRAGVFVGDMLSRPSRIPDAYSRLSWGGVVHWRTIPADMEFLQREISTYGCAVAEVQWDPRGTSPSTGNQHFVVITQLTADGDAIIADPWDGQKKKLSESRYSLPGWSTARTLTGLRLVRPGEEKD